MKNELIVKRIWHTFILYVIVGFVVSALNSVYLGEDPVVQNVSFVVRNLLLFGLITQSLKGIKWTRILLSLLVGLGILGNIIVIITMFMFAPTVILALMFVTTVIQLVVLSFWLYEFLLNKKFVLYLESGDQ